MPSATLLDYFPEDFLLFVDESHITVPQIGGMFNGDRSRKQTLVDYGFRLPSALDNRPLCFDEFLARIGTSVFVSATPGPWEQARLSTCSRAPSWPSAAATPAEECTAPPIEHLVVSCDVFDSASMTEALARLRGMGVDAVLLGYNLDYPNTEKIGRAHV